MNECSKFCVKAIGNKLQLFQAMGQDKCSILANESAYMFQRIILLLMMFLIINNINTLRKNGLFFC